MSTTQTEWTIAFVCSVCGEELETQQDGDFFTHTKYHHCFGEPIGDVAVSTGAKIQTLRENLGFVVKA